MITNLSTGKEPHAPGLAKQPLNPGLVQWDQHTIWLYWAQFPHMLFADRLFQAFIFFLQKARNTVLQNIIYRLKKRDNNSSFVSLEYSCPQSIAVIRYLTWTNSTSECIKQWQLNCFFLPSYPALQIKVGAIPVHFFPVRLLLCHTVFPFISECQLFDLSSLKSLMRVMNAILCWLSGSTFHKGNCILREKGSAFFLMAGEQHLQKCCLNESSMPHCPTLGLSSSHPNYAPSVLPMVFL